jgi:hypothetical protein
VRLASGFDHCKLFRPDTVLFLQAQQRGAGVATVSNVAHILFHRLVHRNGGKLASESGARERVTKQVVHIW